VVGLCVCLSVDHVREPCKTAETIGISFKGTGGPNESCRGQDRTNPFTAWRGDMSKIITTCLHCFQCGRAHCDAVLLICENIP